MSCIFNLVSKILDIIYLTKHLDRRRPSGYAVVVLLGCRFMNVWDVRSAKKSDLKVGKWTSGSMTRSAFPLSRAKTKYYRLGSAYTWRVVTFRAGGCDYRILVSFRTDKEQFSAMLGMDDAGDMKIIARLEFHGTHGGWHIHHSTGEISAIPSGIRVGPWVRRRDCTTHADFGLAGMSEDSERAKVMTIVSDVYGLRQEGGML